VKILLLSSEVAPFAKTGGLADVAGSLPQALQRLGHDVRVVTPAYRVTRETGMLRDTGRRVTATVAGFGEQADVLAGDLGAVPVWLLDHPGYFDRDGLYGTASGDHPDNAERFGFFCRASLEVCRAFDFAPDLLHANDWQTGLAAVLLRSQLRDDPFFAATATLMTIHNLGYQGLFPPEVLAPLGIDPALFHMEALEYNGQVSFLKGGIVFSDVINTVSDTYCREIQTPEYGHGFDGILRHRHNRLFGVLNGILPEEWDSRRLPQHTYHPADLSGKAACKEALQRELGLTVDPELPLVVMVSRLDRQKGFDLLEVAWEGLLQRPLQLAILGSGDPALEQKLTAHAAVAAGRVALSTGFNEDLARRFYAGGDLFLMPSRYEPCGLSQLIALRYGTLPLVRFTGGLADTIVDPLQGGELANGFGFTGYVPEELLAALDRALLCFRDQGRWQAMMRYAMQQDFSWAPSARRYLELYRLAQEIRHGQA